MIDERSEREGWARYYESASAKAHEAIASAKTNFIAHMALKVDEAIPRTMIWPPYQWDATDPKERAKAIAWARDFLARCEP